MPEEYYTEDIDSLPAGVMIEMLHQQQVPRILAMLLTYGMRFASRIGLRPKANSGVLWTPESNWRLDGYPYEAEAKWNPWLEQLRESGFEKIGWINTPTIGPKNEANAWFRNAEGTIFATLNWTQIQAIEESVISLQTYLGEGREIQTLSMENPGNAVALDYITPSYVNAQHVATRNLRELMQKHLETIEGKDFFMLSREDFLNYLPEVKKKFFEHSLQKGTLRKLSDAEVRNLKD